MNQFSGYIFMCNGKTKVDCYRYRVFGLPAARMSVVEKIRPRMTLFLFDFDSKLLYGIYTAASTGGHAIEPTAFGGKFLAQVKFEISKDCLPLPEHLFRNAIIDNYTGGSKFKQELSKEQVSNLISLFHPISIPPALFAKAKYSVELPPACNQLLGAHEATHFRWPGRLSHNQHPWHVCHGSVAPRASELINMQSTDLQAVVPMHDCTPYIPQQTYQTYLPENIAMLQKDTHNSETRLAPPYLLAVSQAAAVVSEDCHEVVGTREEKVQSTSSFMGDMSASVSTAPATFYPYAQESGGSGTSQFVVAASNDLQYCNPSHYNMHSYGGTHLPSSSALDGINMLTNCTGALYGDNGLALGAESLSGRFVQVPPQPRTSSNGRVGSWWPPGSVAHWNSNEHVYNQSHGAAFAAEEKSLSANFVHEVPQANTSSSGRSVTYWNGHEHEHYYNQSQGASNTYGKSEAPM